MARVRFTYEGALPFFGWTGLRSPITELAVSLAAFKNDQVVASGTAVIIAPHLAMAAKHVVADFWKRFEGEEPNSGGNYFGTHCLIAHQHIEKEGRDIVWDVTKIWYSQHTDVAFLFLAIPHAGAKYEWNGVEIDLRPPDTGIDVTAFGYCDSQITIERSSGTFTAFEWKDSPTTSVGRVVEVYEVARDRVMAPFPSFRTNLRLDGGMSGGPVFDADGYLRGLGVTSWEEEHDSLIASLWPSMNTMIDVDLTTLQPTTPYTVFDLVKAGFIKALNADRLSLEVSPDGMRRLLFRQRL